LRRFGLVSAEGENAEYVVPIPEGVSKQDTFEKNHRVWTLGIVNPMVALGTHLDALSLASNPLTQEHHDLDELVSKNKRRAARVATFRSLMKNKFDNKDLRLSNGKQTFKYPEVLKTGTRYFVECEYGKMLLSSNGKTEFKALADKTRKVLSAFGGAYHLRNW
jgi:hypothetical protein